MMGLTRWLLVPVVLSVGLLWIAPQPAEAVHRSIQVTPYQVRYYSPPRYAPQIYRHHAVPRYSHYPRTRHYHPAPVGLRVYAGPVSVHVFGGGYRPYYRYSYPTPIRGPRPIVRVHAW